MTRVTGNFFRQALLLGSPIVLPSVAFGDAGHDVKKAPTAMEGMDHGKMKMDGQGSAAATGWRRRRPSDARTPFVPTTSRASAGASCSR